MSRVGGRDPAGPLRIPVLDKYSDRGLIVMGKVESGTAREGSKIAVLPLVRTRLAVVSKFLLHLPRAARRCCN